MRFSPPLTIILAACLTLLTNAAGFDLRSAHAQTTATATDSLRLTLPPQTYAVVGQPFVIYYDNLILTQSPDKYRCRFTLERAGQTQSLGTHEARHWSFTPEATHVGQFTLRATLVDTADQTLGMAQTRLAIAPATAGAERSLSLLIVGDSLTHGTIYPNELANLLSQPGNPTWKMLGTHKPPTIKPGVAHEGYGGWTWEGFATRFVPKPTAGQPKLNSSPFVFADEQGKPQLKPGRYFDEHCGGERPDVITFLLGINDCFAAPADDAKLLDERIDAVFQHAETLFTAMKQAAPQATLAVCITPPPNVRDGAFEANYKGKYPRWNWRKIQHRLVERQITQFGNRASERIVLVPTELNVDPIDGYPENNGVHPNAVGYRQIAETIYAWLKSRYAE
ncbi:MAG: SGNH/GDSL hydrolase family protein [Planctomycetaceae bacterium]|nr:SGNH/GDSL hydrolase family protein [Planctomycetaceae bacterium]